MASFIARVFMRCPQAFLDKVRLCKRNFSIATLRIYCSVFFLIFSSAFTITVLFPFIPFMVMFLVGVDEVNVGNYVGIVPTAMFVGRFLGSYVWGSIADNIGRKPVVVISILLTGLASGAFGFSVTFEMAVFLRFLVGLFNGIPGTAKAILSESSTNKNQAAGMAVFSTGWGLGMIIGPAIGGLLAVSDPVRTAVNNATLGNVSLPSPTFLEQFPYSPPCLVNAGLCIVTMFVAIFLLPETLQSKKKSKTVNVDESLELEPLVPSDSSSVHDNEEIGMVVHSNETYGVTEQDDSGCGSEENTSGSSSDSVHVGKQAPLSLEDCSTQSVNVSTSSCSPADELVQQDSVTADANIDTDRTADVTPDRTTDVTPDHTTDVTPDRTTDVDLDHDIDGVHAVPFSVDRSNSLHLAYFSGSVEQLLEEVKMNTRRRRISAMLKRQRHSITSTLSHEDCCLCCCQRCPRVKSWSRKMLVGLKKSLKNMYLFLRDATTRKAVIIYCTLSFAIIGFDEMYPVFCKTSPSLGGLGLTQNEIGLSLTIVGILMLPMLLLLFPVLEKRIGSKKAFQYLCILAMATTVLIPTLNAAALQGNKTVLWVLLLSLMTIIRCGIGVGIAAGSLFVNNSVYFHQLASVNGFTMTATSLTRMVAPVVLGPIWSASLTENSRRIGFPFDYHLIFILCGLVYFLCVVIAAMLPKSIDKQKKLVDEVGLEENARTEAETDVEDHDSSMEHPV